MYLEKFNKKTEFIRANNIKYFRNSTWVKLQCDNCHNIYEKEAHEISPKRRNNNYSHYCGTCGNTYLLAGKKGNENKIYKFSNLIGDKTLDSHGYMTIYLGNTYHYKLHCGRIREHIYVMENYLGRILQKGEVVHHIDGNKSNNDLSNLDLCTVQEHNNCHAKAEKIVFELYKKGIVGYDKNTKMYYLKESFSV